MQKAVGLATKGLHVFPCHPNKRPITTAVPHGHLDASNDPEKVATWFSEYPNAYIGVHVGRSDLIVLDLDEHDEGASGIESLEVSWRGKPESFSYPTPTEGGTHTWYQGPAGANIPPSKNYQGLVGVDRKSGSSYVCFYGQTLPDLDALTPAPEWLLETRSVGVGSGYEGFDGDLLKWLDSLEPGDADEKVINAIQRIPETDFGHNEMVERQMEFIRLGAEGHIGVRSGLDLLRAEWLRNEYDTPDHAYEYDSALNTGIAKYGAALARIQSLPAYRDIAFGPHATPGVMDRVMGAPKDKKWYFDSIRYMVKTPLADAEIASLVWSGPRTIPVAREYGIDYLFETINRERLRSELPVDNPALAVPEQETNRIFLLAENERAYLAEAPTFVDLWLKWVSTRVNVINTPYHRQNALACLSMSYGRVAYASRKQGPMPLNLFQIALGESSTGKSESDGLFRSVMNYVFAGDGGYNLGSNPSPEALHKALLGRDRKASLFWADEAAGVFVEILGKAYQAGQVDRLTSYYEGFVPPMLRMGDFAKKKEGPSADTADAQVSFSMKLIGTPRKVTDVLTSEMFESGFLARFVWEISDPPSDDDEKYLETRGSGRRDKHADPNLIAVAASASVGRWGLGTTGGEIESTDEALSRFTRNNKTMELSVRGFRQAKILQPVVNRLRDVTRKVATLLAVQDGTGVVHLRHALQAIGFAENWLNNAVFVSEQIAASEFERMSNAVEDFIREHGGSEAYSAVHYQFKAWAPKDFETCVGALISQGRVKMTEDRQGQPKTLVLNGRRE